jgi:glycosyltransferase involved in cell wall biosynthesis
MLTNNTSNSTRVLHVVGNSRFGGAGWIILGLGRIARAQGWQVDVLTTDPVFQKLVKQEGLGLVDLDVIRREIRPLWDINGLFRLRDFLRREPYRIVHTHTSKGGFVGRLAAAMAGVPVVVHTVHGFAFSEQTPASTRRFYCMLEQIATRWCDRVVSVSEFHRQWALDLRICQPHQIIAIPNGVADCGGSPIADEMRRRMGVRDGELMLLSMARLASDKGLAYLIEAGAILAASHRPCRIVIAGEGPERARLESLARELKVDHMVTFLGFRQDVAELLAACDMVVLPSLREGLSIALLEAMAAGKTIVATDIGSHREVAAQAEMAVLVPPADPKALSQAILKLAGDPAARLRLGAAARDLFERSYTEERMLNSYKQLYFDLLELKCPSQANAARDSRVELPRPDRLPCQPKGGGVWNER